MAVRQNYVKSILPYATLLTAASFIFAMSTGFFDRGVSDGQRAERLTTVESNMSRLQDETKVIRDIVVRNENSIKFIRTTMDIIQERLGK